MLKSKSSQIVCALHFLVTFFRFTFSFPLLSLFRPCRLCILIAVLMREASRRRRRRITHMSCCWLHRPKSRRPARSPNPIKARVCFKYDPAGGSASMKEYFFVYIFRFLRDVPGRIIAELVKSWASFAKILFKTRLMLSEQPEDIPVLTSKRACILMVNPLPFLCVPYTSRPLL